MNIDHVFPTCYAHAARHSVYHINVNGYVNMLRRENYLMPKIDLPQKAARVSLKSCCER